MDDAMPALPNRQRRSTRRALHAAAFAAMIALGACGTPPVTHFHSLMPLEVASRAAAAPTSGPRPLPVIVEPVRVPAQVDQAQWVVRLPDESLAVLEQERWASALPDEFRAALLEQLIVGHGAIDARTQPTPAAPPWRIVVDVRRFDSLPGREARIEGSWTIQGSGAARAATSRCEWLLREPAAAGFAALAAAHRKAVARLADAIAEVLASLSRGEPAPCPAADERR
jgi:uncharacterized lipoprotein YmbA